MPIASGNITPTNPSFVNPPVTPVNNSVLTRGDGIGATTDPWVLDLGVNTAYAVAAITTKITGAPSISVSLQGSMDGSTWTTLTTSTNNTGDTNYTATNANVQFSSLRVFINSTSGGSSPTISAAVTAYNQPQTGSLAGTQNVSGTVTANQGTPAVAANRWPVVITDTGGVNQVSVNNAFGGGVGAARVQLLNSTGGLQEISGGGGVAVGPAAQSAANILSGSATATNTVAAQTIITIPATRTWVGTVSMEIVQTAGTGLVSANVNTAGATPVPLAAVNLATVSANAVTAAGNVSNQLTSGVIYATAPAGNSITLTLTNTSATTNVSHATANGLLL